MKVAACFFGVFANAMSGHSFAQGQNSADPAESGRFYPVALSCPSSKDNGILEIVERNRLGEARSYRVVYENFLPTSVETSIAHVGEKLHSFDTAYATDGPARPAHFESFVEDSNRATKLKLGVCEAAAQDKKKYFQSLEANDKWLR